MLETTVTRQPAPPLARGPSPAGHVPRIGSETWQAGYLQAHAGEQSAYLETVAVADLVRQWGARALDLLALRPGQRVLELGCGSGVFLPRLADAVGSTGAVVGLDHSADLLAVASKRVADAGLQAVVKLQQGDAYALPHEQGTFDAAHCERVLMHLEDPNAALAELRRVVRPGGVVVVAEPDWQGIRFDHPDPDAFGAVFRRALKHRHVDMGLTLFRRLAEVGLVQRRHAIVSAVIDDFGLWQTFGLDLDTAAEQTAREGLFDAARLAAVVPSLKQASDAGRFYSVAVLHVASGVVPAT